MSNCELPRQRGHSDWFSLLSQHARDCGEKTAVAVRLPQGEFEETSYAELFRQVLAFAHVFETCTKPGQIIPLCVSRGADAAAAMLGALVCSRAFCCVNPKLRIPQIEHIVQVTGSPCAVVDETGLLALRGEISPESPLLRPTWEVLDAAQLGRLARKVYERFDAAGRVRDFVSSESLGPRAQVTLSGQGRIGACLFTSGSTGMPKGVLIEATDLLARARAEVDWYRLTSSDVLLNVLPFSFDVGLNQLLSSVMIGAELVVLDSWLPRDLLETVEHRNVTGISGVPSIWAGMLREGSVFDRTGPHRSLRYITVSGGDLTQAQHGRLPALVQGADVFKTYGQTEAFRATCLLPEDYARRPGSVGRPFKGVRLYIARDDGTRAESGEAGEVVHTGLGTMFGYLDGNDAQNKLRDNPWYGTEDDHPKAIFTGDLGYLDGEGFLYLAGRRDDLVKIQGNRVYPGEVRNHIASLPGVASVEVVAVRRGEQAELAAFVVPEPTVAVDPSELRVRLTREVPSYMVPELFLLRDSLPLTVSGKPDRVTLAAQAAELLSNSQPVR